MDLNLLKVVDLAGAFGVFMALGAIYFGAQESCRKICFDAAWHLAVAFVSRGLRFARQTADGVALLENQDCVVAFPRCRSCFGTQKDNADFGIVGSHVGSRRIGGLFGRDEAILNIVRKNPQEMVCKV